MEFWSFCDSMSSRVKNESKPIELMLRKRVAVVEFRVHEKSCNGAGGCVT